MTDAIDITPAQREALLACLRRFVPGATVWAYGSRIKGTARPNSDLDLVVLAPSARRMSIAELKDAVAESSDIPFLVDFHVWDELPERFRDNIKLEHVELA